jgi:multisubunit Na+/H+ antiporter MnhB subunit
MTAVFIFAGVGALISVIDFYLSFIRYPLHRLCHRDRPLKWVSGYPLVGSLLLWFAALSYWFLGDVRSAAIALAFSVLDTGGIHWFAVSWLIHYGQQDQ